MEVEIVPQFIQTEKEPTDDPDDHVVMMESKKSDYSWLKCLMGCPIDGMREITKLDCLHFLCSDDCIEKLKRESKPGEKLKCGKCSKPISTDQLSVKIIPSEIFVKRKRAKDVELLCEHCVHIKPAVAYCPTCVFPLCRGCKELHPQIRKTVSHKLELDLTNMRIEKVKKIWEEESKCKIHDKAGHSYCQTCKVRICQVCLPNHEGHGTVHLQTQKDMLQLKIKDAGNIVKEYKKATKEIERKTEALLNQDLDNALKMVGDNFAVLKRELEKREDKMKKEVKACFLEKVATLEKKMKDVEQSKELSERFVKVGQQIITEGEDIACVNFWALYENFFNEVEKKKLWISTNFDRLVEKGGHFELNGSAASEQTIKLLSNIGGIEYKLTGDGGNVNGGLDNQLCDRKDRAALANGANLIETALNDGNRMEVDKPLAGQLDKNGAHIGAQESGRKRRKRKKHTVTNPSYSTRSKTMPGKSPRSNAKQARF